MFSYRKVGGLHFIRFWRVSVSFCLCSRKTPAEEPRQTPPNPAKPRQTPRLRSVIRNGRRAFVIA